jgi:hypothetical protein
MSKENSDQKLPPPSQMMQHIWPGALAAQAIYTAAKFGIADQLKDGPKTIDELTHATATHARSLQRVLRALASLGVFKEAPAGTFQNTELSATLRRDIPGSIGAWALFLAAPFNWKLWGNLEETVRTGEPATGRVYGKSFWDYLAENPADAEVFNNAMSAGAQMSGAAIASSYDFSAFKKVVDVGGGHGALLKHLLTANPQLRGVLYDLPDVVAKAPALREGDIGTRVDIIGGSFFDMVPEGADLYILQGIIHDWSDTDVVRILKNCRKAIDSSGRLLISTTVLKSTAEPDRGNFMDIYMMLYGGRERTEAELKALLAEADFLLRRVIPTTMNASILESEPV